MSKEYIEAFKNLKQELYYSPNQIPDIDKWHETIEQALQRLESIDNTEPSEALECLEDICKILNEKRIDVKWLFKNDYTTIKQALLKAQKEHNSINLLMQELDCKDFADLRKYARCGYEKLNNKYLKWEDLEFNHTPKMTDVKMSGNKYKLVVGYNVAGKNLAILRDGKKEYYFLECDKQFFNDLHLERVEE